MWTSYLGILAFDALLCALFFLVGWALLRALGHGPATMRPLAFGFAALGLGMFLSVAVFSLAFANTPPSVIFLGLVALTAAYLMQRPALRLERKAGFPLAGLGLALATVVIVFGTMLGLTYEQALGQVWVNGDVLYYSQISESLVLGYENKNRMLALVEPRLSGGVYPYHYFECWLALLGQKASGWRNTVSMALIVVPLLEALSVLGAAAVVEAYAGIQTRWAGMLGFLSLAPLGFNTAALNALPLMDEAYQLISSASLVYPKVSMMVSMSCAALLALASGRLLLCLGTLFVGLSWMVDVGPSVAFAAFAFPLALRWAGKVDGRTMWRAWLLAGLFLAAYGAYYVVFKVPTQVFSNKSATQGLSSLFALGSAVNIVGKTAIQSVVLYLPLVAVLAYAVWKIGIRKLLRAETTVAQGLALLGLLSLGGLLGWAATNKLLDSNQLFILKGLGPGIFLLVLALAWRTRKALGAWVFYGMLALGTALVGFTVSLIVRDNVATSTPSYVHSPEFLSTVSKALNQAVTNPVGGSYLATEDYPDHFIKSYGWFPAIGDLFANLRDSVAVIQLGWMNVPPKAMANYMVRDYATGSLLGLYADSLGRPPDHAMLPGFTRRYGIQYILAGAHGAFPPELEQDFVLLATDARVGERFYLRRDVYARLQH